jgi:hypothetical protein
MRQVLGLLLLRAWLPELPSHTKGLQGDFPRFDEPDFVSRRKHNSLMLA